jgi:hypothetical protein
MLHNVVSGPASPSQLKRTLSAPHIFPTTTHFPSSLYLSSRKIHTLFVACIASQQVCRSEENQYLGSLPSAPIMQVNKVSLFYSTAKRWPHCIYLIPIPLHHLHFISFFAHYLCLSQYLSSFSLKNKNGSRTQLAHVKSSPVHVFYLSSLTIDLTRSFFVHMASHHPASRPKARTDTCTCTNIRNNYAEHPSGTGLGKVGSANRQAYFISF